MFLVFPWSAKAVSCKDLYDLFIKLIDPRIDSGNIVATPAAGPGW